MGKFSNPVATHPRTNEVEVPPRVGDTPRDVAIRQSDNEMKACLGQNVSASLLEAYQTAKTVSKTLVVKGMPTEVSEKDVKEFLDLNRINYTKAERLTNKKMA